jgi:hypothetical protein
MSAETAMVVCGIAAVASAIALVLALIMLLD